MKKLRLQICRLILVILGVIKNNYINKKRGESLVIVLPPINNAWILDSIGREIGSRIKGFKIIYAHANQKLPKSNNYLYLHFIYFFQSIIKNPLIIFKSFNVVYMTHFEPEKFNIDKHFIIKILILADKIVCMNSMMKKDLTDYNIEKEKILVNIGAADKKLFKSSLEIEKIYVGISSAYYERKNPQLIFEVVKKMNKYKFIMLGKGWERYKNFEEMKRLSNFKYIDTEYENYPEWYQKMKVFFSASCIEGGPIPLIEAMMSGAIPVVSNTGFAMDLVKNGINGYIFEKSESVEKVINYISLAYEMKNNLNNDLTEYDWEEFSNKFDILFQGKNDQY